MEHVFTDANFQSEVLQSSIPVVVDFWAEWCGPCRMMAPIVEEAASELDAQKVKIGKLNVDQNQETAQQLGIMSIPTFLIFKNGKVIDQMVGAMTKDAFKQRISKHVV
ncbi:MAG TPA: thioredoxin [Patescibacteria group bacterium]|nr:thioredoxin [Patescibacteria group bacterium]